MLILAIRFGTFHDRSGSRLSKDVNRSPRTRPKPSGSTGYGIRRSISVNEERDPTNCFEAGLPLLRGEFRLATWKYHRVERSYGSFVRNFSLPDDASPAKVSAEFEDGVLTVHLAKTEKAKPQQIEVKVA
ncbi:MAG: Hsp20 family protein [Verrucomicrobia bacterium]|nr:Hsp20 family protein [Verrucomicrobiota bacterium]